MVNVRHIPAVHREGSKGAGCCAAPSPLASTDFFFPAERADVLLGVLRKTLPKATDGVWMRCSLGAVGNALAGDGDLKTSSTHETKWRANDGGHDGHLADVVRPRQPCAAAG